MEWFNSLLFDALLLIVEAAINLWLATALYNEGFVTEYRAIVVMLILPSLINPVLWMRLKSTYRLGTWFVFIMLFIGFPSPVFL